MNDKKLMFDYLLTKYDKSSLNKSELAVELSISIPTVNRRLRDNINLPRYKQVGSRIIFPIVSVAEFLASDL
jgi:hypothetical protein